MKHIIKYFILILKTFNYYIPIFNVFVKKIIYFSEKLQKNILFAQNDRIIYNISKKSKIILDKKSFIADLILKDFEFEERYIVPKLLNKNGHFIDIGANIGLYSIIASEYIKNGIIYAIEPSKKTIEKLNSNIIINNINNIRIINLAITDKDFKQIELYNNNDGFEAFNNISKPLTSNYSIEMVDSESLDHLIKSREIDINEIQFIKIDVEGSEYDVLLGANKILQKGRHIIYMIEFNEDYRLENKCRLTYELLKDNKFDCYYYSHHIRKLINIEKFKEKIVGNFFVINNSNIRNITEKLNKLGIEVTL
jgi:FkbM family methyltransferase